MAESKRSGVKLTGVRGRLAFASNVFNPRENINDKGEKKKSWNATIIMPKGGEQEKRILAAMKQAAKEKWKDKAQKLYSTLQKQDRLCLHDGETKDEYDGFNDEVVFVSANSNTRPRVTDRQKNDVTAEDGVIYSGCNVSCVIEIYAQDSKDWGKRINATIKAVQFVSDGDAFAGGGSVDDDDLEDLDEIDGSDVDDDDDSWGDDDDNDSW